MWFGFVRPEFKEFQWNHRMVKSWVDKKPNPKRAQKSAKSEVKADVAYDLEPALKYQTSNVQGFIFGFAAFR